jgi:hypothetical protein
MIQRVFSTRRGLASGLGAAAGEPDVKEKLLRGMKPGSSASKVQLDETTYDYDKNGQPFLTKEPKLLLNDNDAGKPRAST